MGIPWLRSGALRTPATRLVRPWTEPRELVEMMREERRIAVPSVQIFDGTTGEADGALEPSPDRPFAVVGLDPDRRPIRPRRFADGETARHVAQVLRAVGYSVSVTPPLRVEPGRRTTIGGARRA